MVPTRYTVGDVMTRNAIAVTPGAAFREIADTMRRYEGPCPGRSGRDCFSLFSDASVLEGGTSGSGGNDTPG
ncbi:hypothetical protein ACFU6R_10240 [Streptomyces sp. NPDC057499]|uniref:hypothetical protein n=1 Tax=Streptomyces sp. NPDC057499 TaxID=3346150 RepID=UPI00368AA3C9